MLKSNRLSFVLAVFILLAAAFLRLGNFTTLPPGFNAQEILDIRLADNVRQGYIQVFYNIGGDGREGFYHTMLTAVTSYVGGGLLGYRILSAWVGLVTIALMYALARRLYGNLAGIAAMGLLAFGLYPVFLSRLVGRETLLPLVTIGVMLTMAFGLPVYWRLRGNQTQTTAFTAFGLTLGLGLYIHPAGLMVMVFSLLFIAYIFRLRQPLSRSTINFIAFGLLIAVIFTTPYLISAIRFPDLSAAARLFNGLTREGSNLFERVLNGLLAIGIRGDWSAITNLPGRPMFDPLSMVLMLGGIGVAIRNRSKPRYVMPLIALGLLLPLGLLSPDSPSFLPFAIVLPVLALMFGLGVTALASTSSIPMLGVFGLVALLIIQGVWTGTDLLIEWGKQPEVQTLYNGRLGQLAHHVDQVADDLPVVVCAERINPSAARRDLTNGQLMSLMMHRKDTRVHWVDCDSGLVFVNGGDWQQVILTAENTLQTANPFIQEWLSKAVPIDNLPQNSGWVMRVAPSLADTLGKFTTTIPVTYPPEANVSDFATRPPQRFEGNLTFLGYQIPAVNYYPPGGIVTVVTYWRVDGVLPSDLTLFTHILSDPSVRPVAQTDALSVMPSQLSDRDVFIQVTYIPLSSLVPTGQYTISTGAYQGGDKQRMGILDEAGNVIADRLFLYDIDVRAGN